MADGAESEAVPKSGGSKLVPVLLVANLILVAALLCVFVMRGGVASPKPAEAAPRPVEDGKSEGAKGAQPGPTQKLADFVVHLRDPETDRYARVSFEVEVASEEEKERLIPYMPRIRDAFISYLSDRTLEELRGSESISRTKSALSERMAQLSPGVRIKGLYVTDLVIQ